MTDNQPEVWLRGPLPDITPLLQPVAHSFLQSKEEIQRYTAGFPEELLWIKPAGMASAGFHLQHINGVTDRLFTYARQEALSPEQLLFLQQEGMPDDKITVKTLVSSICTRIELSLAYLGQLDPAGLTAYRPVGRKALPSTVLGLLFHASEHTQRHVGQLYVTIGIVQATNRKVGVKGIPGQIQS